MDKKKKEDLKIKIPNNIDHIYCDSIRCGRVPIPIDNEGLGTFSIYQPNFSEILKEIYEGLIRIWLKQGKDPFEEFEKRQQKLKEMDKKEKENDKIDWSTYTSNLPFVLWSFWFYFWGIFTEIFYFKSSLMHYNRGTGVAIIPPQRALFNLLIPSCLWNYLKNKKEKGNEDKNRSGEEN